MSRSQLDALVGKATVDCYNEDEQLTGLFATTEDNLVMPLTTRVLGVEVTVRRVDLVRNAIVAVCCRGRFRQLIGILEMPLPDPLPPAVQWIEAYRHWVG